MLHTKSSEEDTGQLYKFTFPQLNQCEAHISSTILVLKLPWQLVGTGTKRLLAEEERERETDELHYGNRGIYPPLSHREQVQFTHSYRLFPLPFPYSCLFRFRGKISLRPKLFGFTSQQCWP